MPKGKTLFDAHTPNTDFNPTGRFSSVVFFTSLALGLRAKGRRKHTSVKLIIGTKTIGLIGKADN